MKHRIFIDPRKRSQIDRAADVALLMAGIAAIVLAFWDGKLVGDDFVTVALGGVLIVGALASILRTWWVRRR